MARKFFVYLFPSLLKFAGFVLSAYGMLWIVVLHGTVAFEAERDRIIDVVRSTLFFGH